MFLFDGWCLWAIFTACAALNVRWFPKSIEWNHPETLLLREELRQSAPQIGFFCTDRGEGSSNQGHHFSGNAGPFFHAAGFFNADLWKFLCRSSGRVSADSAHSPQTLLSTHICVYFDPHKGPNVPPARKTHDWIMTVTFSWNSSRMSCF